MLCTAGDTAIQTWQLLHIVHVCTVCTAFEADFNILPLKTWHDSNSGFLALSCMSGLFFYYYYCHYFIGRISECEM